jgi:signal transduction histidine kinase/DNA-binding response OmpR family regulator
MQIPSLFVLVVALFTCNPMSAQVAVLDSLHLALKNHPENDTSKVKLLNALSLNAWGSDPHKARTYAEAALPLAKSLNYTKGIADSYREISRYYWSQTEYDKSTDFALMALKEYERCHDLTGVSWCYASIGTSYSQANNFAKAFYYHNLALDLNRKINNKRGISRNLNSLGYVNELLKDYTKALEYYTKALDMRILLGDKADLTLSYSNVGSIHFYLEHYQLALDYLNKALPLAEEIDNKNYIALIYQNIGEVYTKTGKYIESDSYLKSALSVALAIGDKKRREGVYEALKTLEETRKNYKGAFRYLKLLQDLRDTLYTQDRSRQMAKMETLYETEKKEQTIKLLEQEHHIQTMWRKALTGGIILIALATTIIIFLQRSRTRKAKQLLEVQESLNDKLKEVDKMKSHFFANISHEFRTPLTLILAPLDEKLNSQDLTPAEKEMLMLMRRNANRLLDLVNQLLDLSKLEARKMQLAVKQDDLKEFVKTLTASFDSLAEIKGVHFIKNISLPATTYWFDADVLEKILNNVLSNAFKFTPIQGTVTVGIEPAPTKGDSLRIQVSDTGRGIPLDEQQEIFSPFYQAKNMADNGQPGTGLGLSLVKELVKLYNGSIELVSHENYGTTITICIPVAKYNFTNDERTLALTNPEKRLIRTMEEDANRVSSMEQEVHSDVILIIEDNKDLRDFITSILQKEFTVLAAANGEEGLSMARQHVPSLIVSDLMMPVMDGIAMTERIKNDERTSHIPIVLLTAKNEYESRLEGFKTGADDYLTKPFSTEELCVRITNLIEQRKRIAARYRDQIMVSPVAQPEISMDERFLQKAIAVVEHNMGDFSFGVERMADEINLSRTQLLRKLKALTGLPPNEFIKDLRLKRAAMLLAAKADTVTQIGYRVGFNDQSYFTKCFKKQFNVSPSEYVTSGKAVVK